MEAAALRVGGEVALAANGAHTGSSGEPSPKPRTRSDVRIQKAHAAAHDAAHAALTAVSSYLDADEDLPAFFLRLGEAIAEQVGASKVAFWVLGPRGALTVQPSPFGFGEPSPIHEMRLEIEAGGERVMEKVVFRDDLQLGRGTSVELDDFWHACGLADVKSSIAVSWRAGERRIGAVVAYDSKRGFSANDVRVLRLAAMATGLVWQYKEAEDELVQTAVRLEETVAARRRLLNNVAAGGDEARRHFASAIHDDSLQLLTGAELQLERIRAEANGSHQAVQLDQLRNTLRKVEDSLRRLLINVSPQALELRRDLKDAIGERLESMRLSSGIETHSDLRSDDPAEGANRAVAVAAGGSPTWQDRGSPPVAQVHQVEATKSLLVVEGDPVQRQFIVDLMKPVNAATTAVATGDEALEFLAREAFDCVVLDLGLQGSSGWKVIEELEASKVMGSTPLLVYTTRELTRKEEARLNKAARSIVIKDARSPERLREEIAAILTSSEPSTGAEVVFSSRMPEAADGSLAGTRVLVVDDDIRNIFALTAVLERHGMNVISVDSGREAIEGLKENGNIDVALVDVMMPEMDGYATMSELRKLPMLRDKPIIALTAKAMKGDREKCLEAGASDYIAKPVNNAQLLALLKSWVAP